MNTQTTTPGTHIHSAEKGKIVAWTQETLNKFPNLLTARNFVISNIKFMRGRYYITYNRVLDGQSCTLKVIPNTFAELRVNYIETKEDIKIITLGNLISDMQHNSPNRYTIHHLVRPVVSIEMKGSKYEINIYELMTNNHTNLKIRKGIKYGGTHYNIPSSWPVSKVNDMPVIDFLKTLPYSYSLNH